MSVAGLFSVKVEWTLSLQLSWWADLELCIFINNRTEFCCVEGSS